jgi:hypothetical protein
VAIRYEMLRRSAACIFDLQDRFARDRGVRGPRPRPIGPVTFRLLAEMTNGGRQLLDPPLELDVRPNASGYHLFFNTVRLPNGSVRDVALSGTYAVRFESQFYQAAERADIQFPEPANPYAVDLEPGYAYPFPTESTLSRGRGLTLLRGGVYDVAGRGLADTVVEVAGQSNAYRTDDTGEWVLIFPDTQAAGDVTVRFTFADGTVQNVAAVHLDPGREQSLQQAALRGWVQQGSGLAVPNATIQVAGQLATSATDGSWRFCFGLNQPLEGANTVTVTATLPDGRSKSQPNVSVQRRATVIVPTFRFSQP